MKQEVVFDKGLDQEIGRHKNVQVCMIRLLIGKNMGTVVGENTKHCNSGDILSSSVLVNTTTDNGVRLAVSEDFCDYSFLEDIISVNDTDVITYIA